MSKTIKESRGIEAVNLRIAEQYLRISARFLRKAPQCCFLTMPVTSQTMVCSTYGKLCSGRNAGSILYSGKNAYNVHNIILLTSNPIRNEVFYGIAYTKFDHKYKSNLI